MPVHEDLHRDSTLMTFFIAFGDNRGRDGVQRLLEVWHYGLLLTAFVLLIKPLLVFTILARLQFVTSFQAAVATAQISEFSFILLGLAAASGLMVQRWSRWEDSLASSPSVPLYLISTVRRCFAWPSASAFVRRARSRRAKWSKLNTLSPSSS